MSLLCSMTGMNLSLRSYRFNRLL